MLSREETEGGRIYMAAREIIFRGKRKDTGKWIEGDVHLWGPDAFIFSALDFPDGPDWYEVDPETVGQYAGQNDKNGKQVFEGDIILVTSGGIDEDDGNAVIVWDDETSRFIIEWHRIVSDFDSFYGHDMEVIGNIHDNPELLGGNEDG